jgi:hypothetical protein
MKVITHDGAIRKNSAECTRKDLFKIEQASYGIQTPIGAFFDPLLLFY